MSATICAYASTYSSYGRLLVLMCACACVAVYNCTCLFIALYVIVFYMCIQLCTILCFTPSQFKWLVKCLAHSCILGFCIIVN